MLWTKRTIFDRCSRPFVVCGQRERSLIDARVRLSSFYATCHSSTSLSALLGGI